MTDPFSRREFLKKSGAGAGLAGMTGPAVLRSLGASDQIRAGFVGLGIRGNFLLGNVLKSIPGVQVAGICDAYQGYIKRAIDTTTKAGRPAPEVFSDYRKMLDSKNIDAVLIATPEHWHHRMGLDAIAAGKDMYLEKALAHTVEEGEDLVKAAQKSKVIVQVGTQRRSSPIYKKAREIFESGVLGKVTVVRAFWYRNTMTPQWRYPIGLPETPVSPQTCNWEAFLGPAKKRPWDQARMFQWRLYWDYSQGIATDLMTHQLDGVHMVTGATAPESVISQGGIYLWDDGREVPDTWHSVFQYPGFTVDYTCMFGNSRFGYGEEYLGSESTLQVLDLKTLILTPETIYEKKYPERKAITINTNDLDPTDCVIVHQRNFFECMKTRTQPNCTVAVGEQAATPCHLAIQAYKAKRQVNWNAATRKAALA